MPERLDSFIYDYIRGKDIDERYCEICQRVQSFEIDRELIKLPNVMIFRLERFSYHPKLKKNRDVVEFEDGIKLLPIVSKDY